MSESLILQKIDKACQDQNINQVLTLCKYYNYDYLGLFLTRVLQTKRKHSSQEMEDDLDAYCDYFNKCVTMPSVRIKFGGDATGRESDWVKMSQDGEGRWNHLTTDEYGDYSIIINQQHSKDELQRDRTLIFTSPKYVFFHETLDDIFLKVFKQTYHWNLSWTYQELISKPITKTSNALSSVRDRIEFDTSLIDFLKGKNDLDMVEGSGDDAYFPYKYVLVREDKRLTDYFSEKVVDAILAECLCFYWGCPNLPDFIDSRAYIRIEMSNFEDDYTLIKKTMENNGWEKRLEIIKLEKYKILNQKQLYPQLDAYIKSANLKN
jgi:hypothetical protein